MRHAREFFIGGEWCTPHSRETTAVINPADESVLCEIALGDPQDAQRAILAARAAFDDFSISSREERIGLLEAVIEAYEARSGELAELVLKLLDE